MRENAFITAVKAKLDECAVASMERPAGTDAHAYGRAIGLYTGLKTALDIWESCQRDEAEKDKKL